MEDNYKAKLKSIGYKSRFHQDSKAWNNQPGILQDINNLKYALKSEDPFFLDCESKEQLITRTRESGERDVQNEQKNNSSLTTALGCLTVLCIVSLLLLLKLSHYSPHQRDGTTPTKWENLHCMCMSLRVSVGCTCSRSI